MVVKTEETKAEEKVESKQEEIPVDEKQFDEVFEKYRKEPEAKTVEEVEEKDEEKEEEKVKEKVEEKAEKEVDEKEEEYEDIPQEQIEAGRAAGLADEAIVKLAEENPVALKALANFHVRVKSGLPEVKAEAQEKEEKVKGPEVLDYVEAPKIDFADEKVSKVFTDLVGNQNKLIDHINKVNKNQFEQEKIRMQARQAESTAFDAKIDSHFDSKVKDCPSVGLSASLSPEQIESRQNIWAVAKALPSGTLEQRLDEAVVMWGSRTGDSVKKAEANLVKKLERTKKKFSPRPGGQRTEKDTRTAEEKGLADFDKVADKHSHKWE